MPRTVRDTTWNVADKDGNCFVELDVRLYADYNTPSDDPDITDVKALFHKHGKLCEFDMPDDLQALCIRQLQRDATLMADWAQQIAEDEKEGL